MPAHSQTVDTLWHWKKEHSKMFLACTDRCVWARSSQRLGDRHMNLREFFSGRFLVECCSFPAVDFSNEFHENCSYFPVAPESEQSSRFSNLRHPARRLESVRKNIKKSGRRRTRNFFSAPMNNQRNKNSTPLKKTHLRLSSFPLIISCLSFTGSLAKIGKVDSLKAILITPISVGGISHIFGG